MKPSELIKSLRPSELAKARGRAQNHSSRDKSIYIKQIEEVEATFGDLGYKLIIKKKTN